MDTTVNKPFARPDHPEISTCWDCKLLIDGECWTCAAGIDVPIQTGGQ